MQHLGAVVPTSARVTMARMLRGTQAMILLSAVCICIEPEDQVMRSAEREDERKSWWLVKAVDQVLQYHRPTQMQPRRELHVLT